MGLKLGLRLRFEVKVSFMVGDMVGVQVGVLGLMLGLKLGIWLWLRFGLRLGLRVVGAVFILSHPQQAYFSDAAAEGAGANWPFYSNPTRMCLQECLATPAAVPRQTEGSFVNQVSGRLLCSLAIPPLLVFVSPH